METFPATSGVVSGDAFGVVSDLLFPVHQQQQLAAGIQAADPAKNVSYLEMDSVHGHDSFLVDMDQLRPIVQDFFCRD